MHNRGRPTSFPGLCSLLGLCDLSVKFLMLIPYSLQKQTCWLLGRVLSRKFALESLTQDGLFHLSDRSLGGANRLLCGPPDGDHCIDLSNDAIHLPSRGNRNRVRG